MRMEVTMNELKDELASEREARQVLEKRVAKLEESRAQQPQDDDAVDKAKIVIGGFVDVEAEEAEKIVRETLSNAPGFQDVHVTSPTPTVVFAHFDTPANAMKLFRGQKWNPSMLESKLWASENRSPMERRKCKIASKIKRALIEVQGVDAKDIVVNYRAFNVKMRVASKGWKYVCSLAPDGNVEWSDEDGNVAPSTRDNVAQLVMEMDV